MAKVGVDDAMIARMWAKEAPLGFNNADQFNLFKTEMDDAFKQAGLTDAEVGLKGTSTTFYSENPSKRLGHHWDADPANLGDYDINITSPTMKAKLDELGIAPSEKYGVFKTRDIESSFKPLDDFQKKWAAELGRDVNFVGYPKPVARDATEYILRARGATSSVNDVHKLRIQQLTAEGHGVQRHGAGISPIQLESRSVQGLDPMTGTRVDGVHGGTHQYAQHATKVLSDEAYIYAENFARNSQQFVDATSSSRTGRAQLEIPLSNIYGVDFREFVSGVTRYGPKNSPTGFGNTVFSDNAHMVVRYKQDKTGNWLFNTMFPQP